MPFIEIYTKEDCPLCETAKTKLQEKNISFTEYKIGTNVTREDVLEKFPGRRSVPIVLCDGVEVREVKDFQLLLEG